MGIASSPDEQQSIFIITDCIQYTIYIAGWLHLAFTASAHTHSVLARIARIRGLAVIVVTASIPALSIITRAAIAAVRAHSTFLARSLDTSSSRTAFIVAVTRRGFTPHNRHTVSHRAIVLIVSARIAFPALSAVPHRLQIDCIMRSNQTVLIVSARIAFP